MPSSHILFNNILKNILVIVTRLEEMVVNFWTKMIDNAVTTVGSIVKKPQPTNSENTSCGAEFFSESPCLHQVSRHSSQRCYWGEKLCLLLAGTQQLAGTHARSSHCCSNELPLPRAMVWISAAALAKCYRRDPSGAPPFPLPFLSAVESPSTEPRVLLLKLLLKKNQTKCKACDTLVPVSSSVTGTALSSQQAVQVHLHLHFFYDKVIISYGDDICLHVLLIQ